MYIKITIFLLFISFGRLDAQINKGKKYFIAEKFEEAIEAFENDLEKPINQPISLEQLANVYLQVKYEKYNPYKAYRYMERAIQKYSALPLKDRKKIQKRGFSKMNISSKMKDIIRLELSKVEQKKSIAVANLFIKRFKNNSNHNQQRTVNDWRNKWALAKATKKNTYTAFLDLMTKYELSFMEYSPERYIELQKKLLESYIAEKGWAMYPAFEEKYIDNPYVLEQQEAYDLIKIYRKRSLKNMKAYIQSYPHSLFVKFAKQYLQELTIQSSDILHYDYFVRSYPNYDDDGKIWMEFLKLYLQENGSKSIVDFVNTYTEFPFKDNIEEQLQKARIQKEKPVFEAAIKSNNSLELIQFLEKNPQSALAKEAEAPLAKQLEKDGNLRSLQFFLQRFPNSSLREQILEKLYQEYTKDGELNSLDQFRIDYPEYNNLTRIKEDLKTTQKGAALPLTQKYKSSDKKQYEDYIRAAAPKERAFVTLQRLIEEDINAKKWALAIAKIEQFESYFDGSKKVAELKALLKQNTPPISKINLGDQINTNADEYVPIISVDNQQLFFCRWDVDNENIYVSNKNNGAWEKATYIEGLNNNKVGENEGPLSISADNNKIIVFKNGDLYYANKTAKGWQELTPFPAIINTNEWEADAILSSDGKALIFSSKRNDLLDLYIHHTQGFHGDGVGNTDLFVSVQNEKGNWQTPINMGAIINTPYLERTPFLHPDMKTLYFSSDGHGGLGRLDVYKTTRLDDSWTNWSTPVNLGKAINTPENDWGYKVSTDGEIAYFAFKESNQKGQDLYKIVLPTDLRPEKVSIISGQLKDANNNPLFAEIVWEDLETGKEVGRLKSNPTTGEFFITLPNHKKYSYYIRKKGYFPKSNHIDLKSETNTTIIKEDLKIIKISEMVEKELALPLQNLFFATGKYELEPSSFLELDRLAEIIETNNYFQTEIAGHTDSQGLKADNLKLSQNRAEAVKEYLVKKGCDGAKITAKGYGANKPIGDNKTAAGRQNNRRVEVLFSR